MSDGASPIRVGINILPVQQGGGLSYVQGVLPHLAADPLVTIVLFAVEGMAFPGAANAEVRVQRSRGLIRRTVWEQVVLPDLVHQEKLDVLFAPGNQGPVLRKVPLVILVQNADPLVPLPKGTPPAFRTKMALLRAAVAASARRARRVVTASEYVRVLLAERCGIAPDVVDVIPLGAPEDVGNAAMPEVLADLERRGLTPGSPIVLALSNITYNKNIPTLIRAFARARRLTGQPLRLAVAGRVIHTWCLPEIRDAMRQPGVEDAVVWLGWVNAEVRRALFVLATVLAFPSTVEAFPLPPLEAMAYGVPVLASPIAATREVCADAALYVPSDDEAAIADGLVRILVDDGLREQLVTRGRARAAQFTWRATARRTLPVLRAAAWTV